MLYFDELSGSDFECDYVNYKGERSHRRISPRSIRFGTSHYHPEPQWLMAAADLDKGALREFAMKDMTNVKDL